MRNSEYKVTKCELNRPAYNYIHQLVMFPYMKI